MANYYEQIAQIRQQRAQQDIAQRVEQIRNDLSEYTAARDAAAGNYHGAADQETREENIANFHALDRECAQLEAELAQFVPQQPQIGPRTRQFINQNAEFYRRGGQASVNASLAAHEAAIRTGLVPETADYEAWCKNYLEMYSPAFGTRFDPSAEVLSPDEACKISGVSPQRYNQMRHKMLSQGKNSDTLYGNKWTKKVG